MEIQEWLGLNKTGAVSETSALSSLGLEGSHPFGNIRFYALFFSFS